MTTVIRGIVGWPYHPPLWRCHSTDWGYRGSAQSLDRASSHHFLLGRGRGWGGSTSDSAAGSVGIAKNSCIKPRASSYQAGFFVEGGGWGGSTSGSASGSLGIANNFRAKPSKPFFFSRGGGGGSTSGSASGSVVIASNICTNPGASSHQTVFFVEGGLGRFDFGFGFGFGGRSEQCLYKARCIIPANCFFFEGGGGGSTSGSASGSVVIASNICTNPGASSHQTVFFVEGGLGRFDFGFGFGFVKHCEQFSYKGRKGWGRFDFGFCFGFGGHCEQYLHKSWCIIPSNCFFLSRGGWGGSTSGSASGSLGIASNFRDQRPVHHRSRPFFCRWGVGKVRLRVRLRVRWSFRAMSVQSPVHHPSKPFFF